MSFKTYQLPEPTTETLCLREYGARDDMMDDEENDLHGEGLAADGLLKGAREADGEDGGNRGTKTLTGVWNRVASGDRGSVDQQRKENMKACQWAGSRYRSPPGVAALFLMSPPEGEGSADKVDRSHVTAATLPFFRPRFGFGVDSERVWCGSSLS